MVALPHYPSTLFAEGRLQWELMGTTIGSGQTASGAMPVTRLDGGGRWKATFSEVGLWSADHLRTWRALAAVCDGGAQPVVFQNRESAETAPWPLVGGQIVTSFPVVGHSDGSLFSDGTGYASNVINAKSKNAAALRATSMTVAMNAGGQLRGGEHFSIDHPEMRWRMYRVRSAVDNGDGTFAITFRPPLREAIAAATELEFDHPRCVMRLASPDAMDATLEDVFFGRPSIALIEADPPFPVLSA